MATSNLLEMKNITKIFSGNKALNDVSFDLKKGEIHSLVGENGAGKSTLIKILGGVYFPEKGEITIDGEKKKFTGSKDSLNAGVGIIYQEFNLVPTLSIAENIYLGKELVNDAFGSLNRKKMVQNANDFMQKLGFETLDCGKAVASLSVAQQQMVEITKALFNHSKILVLDEPTAVLTEKESRKLFEIIVGLKKSGVGIIYISHRLEEVLELSDRITVLRDGMLVNSLDNSEKSIRKDQLVNMMVGRNLESYYPNRTPNIKDQIVLEVSGLTKKNRYSDISFGLRNGEILGITGLVGAGRTEVVKSIFGAMKYDSGKILIDEKEVQIKSPSDAISHGIAFIPENRKEEGLVLDSSIVDNISLANFSRISKRGFIKNKLQKALAELYFRKLDIRPAEPMKKARNFSGGNQQKAIIAKWIATVPRILIVDEPTRGIDIGAKAEIYKLMNELVEQGLSILMVSSEMPEVMGMCDRVIVMWEGKITGEFNREDFDQEKIMAASSGIKGSD